MRRIFIKRTLSSRNIMDTSAEISNIKTVREQILNATLLGATILSVIALFIVAPMLLQQGNQIFAVIYLLIIFWLSVITFTHRMAFQFRALSLLGIILGLGLVFLAMEGFFGDGRIFLFVFPLISTVLLGNRTGFLSLLISWGLLGGLGFWSMRGLLPFGEISFTIDSSQELNAWGLAMVIFMLVSAVSYTSLCVLFNSLNRIIRNEENLNADLQAERTQLERRVQLRSQDLEHRVTQIQTAAEISNKFYAILDPEELLQQAVELIQSGLDLYYVGIFEVGDSGDWAIFKAGSGDIGKQLLASVPTVPINSNSLVGWAIQNRKVRLAFDIGQNAFPFNYPLLPDTHSELAVPLLFNRTDDPLLQTAEIDFDRSCLGAITCQSNQPMAFDTEDIAIYQKIADSLVKAWVNARLFQKTRYNLDNLSSLNRQYLREVWSRVPRYHGILSYSTEVDLSQKKTGNFETITFPFVLRDQIIGVMAFENMVKDGEAFTLNPEERTFINVIIAEAAQALETVRLLEESNRHARNERFLSGIAHKIRRSTDLDTILKLAIKELGQGLGASEASIRLQVPAADLGDTTKQD